MDDRRFQVFVSSTFLDLQEERSAVVSSLLQMEAFPAGMELFPAADDDAWTLIRRVIDSSDYYLLVIGGKYGSVDPETEISYTEMEYDYAVAESKPVMAFLHADPESIELGRSEKDEATRASLDAFRERVQAEKHVKYWKGRDDLAGKVALTFADFRQRYPAVGWVRGDTQTSAEALAELNDVRKRLAAAEQGLAEAKAGPPVGSERFAQGDDPASIEVRLAVKAMHSGQPRGAQMMTFNGVARYDISWDEYFACVGPSLIDEANETSMRSRIDLWLSEHLKDYAHDRVTKTVEDDGHTISRFAGLEASIDSTEFGTLIVQLRALGLIAKSERKRSVRDTGSYWTLTPYGDERLTALRAILRVTSS